jgi:hypothetical protein
MSKKEEKGTFGFGNLLVQLEPRPKFSGITLRAAFMILS